MSHKSTRTTFDRVESRRDQRHVNPVVTMRIFGRDYPSINWSLGGFQIKARDLGLAVGDGVSGAVVVTPPAEAPPIVEDCGFGAEIAWTDPRAGTAGAKFTKLGSGAFDSLDRVVGRWLKRRRP